MLSVSSSPKAQSGAGDHVWNDNISALFATVKISDNAVGIVLLLYFFYKRVGIIFKKVINFYVR